MKDNQKIFNRVHNKTKDYSLVFESSNGGTGKTVWDKFYRLRRALDHNEPFHIYARFNIDIERGAQSWTMSKPSYSKRKQHILKRIALVIEKDEYILVEASTGRKIAQFLSIHNQAKYKPVGNIIAAHHALFDEVLAENGAYCPDEINKFNRLIHTMARSDDYKVKCLYNNTNPNFPYFKYFGGKSYNTHVSDSGAYFYFFTAEQYRADDGIKDSKSIQSILQNTQYNDVYNNNMFVQFPNYSEPADMRGASTLFKIEIQSKIFKLRIHKNGYIYIDAKHANKKKKSKRTYTVDKHEYTTLKQLPDDKYVALKEYANQSLIKAHRMDDTVFVNLLVQSLV